MQKNKGFTLIELLVVIAIIGILATVIMVSLNSSKVKSQKAAFKKEVTSYQSKAIVNCTGATSALVPPANTNSTTWGVFTDNCSNGDGTFLITATSAKVGTCTASVNETNSTFSAGCK